MVRYLFIFTEPYFNVMNYKTISCLLVVLLTLSTTFAQKYTSTAQQTVTTQYNGMDFTSDSTLLENLVQSEDFSTISGIIEAQGASIFTEGFMGTVFVMLNTSFDTDEEEVVNISSPDVQKKLLKFHVVPGRLDEHGIRKAISNGGGSAYFSTLAGENLGARLENDTVVLFDAENHTAKLLASDLYHKHGFFHIIEGLLMPNL